MFRARRSQPGIVDSLGFELQDLGSPVSQSTNGESEPRRYGGTTFVELRTLCGAAIACGFRSGGADVHNLRLAGDTVASVTRRNWSATVHWRLFGTA